MRARTKNRILESSVVDPDPYVFGPSGSVTHSYGSGSFHHQSKILRKTLISTILWRVFDRLSIKTDVIAPSKSTLWAKNFEKKTYFLLASCQPLTEKRRIRIRKSMKHRCKVQDKESTRQSLKWEIKSMYQCTVLYVTEVMEGEGGLVGTYS